MTSTGVSLTPPTWRGRSALTAGSRGLRVGFVPRRDRVVADRLFGNASLERVLPA